METTLVSLAWADILKLAIGTALGTGVVTALIQWWKDSLIDKSTRERDAAYLALRLAVMLEEYAIKCADIISENMMHKRSKGDRGREHSLIPEFQDYFEDTTWRFLDMSLAARLLSFPNEVRMSIGVIRYYWQLLDKDAVLNETDQQAGKCGYRSWLIAADLRKRYRMPAFDPKQVVRDIENILKKEHDKSFENLKKIREKG